MISLTAQLSELMTAEYNHNDTRLKHIEII
jgi:hypothetical protein